MGATKRLLVNADDLGLVAGINRGIERAFREGIVRSASLLVNAPGFDDALGLVKKNPSLPVGVHLTLVGGDGPVSAPSTVPTLVDGRGRFPASYGSFIARYAAVARREVERELSAQIERALAAGISPTHLDSHQHLHLLPMIGDVVVSLARRYSIGRVRCPRGVGGAMGPGVSLLAVRLRRKIERGGLAMCDHFAGFSRSGRLTQAALVEIIRGLGEGTTELMVHPGHDSSEAVSRYGWKMSWEEELSALVSGETREALRLGGVQLIGNLGPPS
jgi:predicted glycoside hydrolase/deacetylase ChbG (UPF0249 family)